MKTSEIPTYSSLLTESDKVLAVVTVDGRQRLRLCPPQGPAGAAGADGAAGPAGSYPHNTLTYAASLALDFATDGYYSLSLTGDVTFTTSNRSAGKALSIRVAADNSSRTLTFPTGWKWLNVASAPASIAAQKTGVLSVTAFGTAETDIVAVWAVQV